MATQTRGPAPDRAAKPNRPARRTRTTPVQFVTEVRDELRKVVWPTRKELVTYTTVALVFILIIFARLSAVMGSCGIFSMRRFGSCSSPGKLI